MEFYKLLATILHDKRLTSTDKCIMSILVTHSQFAEDQTVELSANEISQIAGATARTIQRCIKHLSELNYIEIIRNSTKKNRYKVLIDIPKGQPAPQIKQKKNSNKLQSEDDFIAEAKRVMLANPFLKVGDDE